MKIVLTLVIAFFSMNSFSDIEYSSKENGKATTAEINRNRSCFEQLNIQGCGDPGEDISHFKSCLKNVSSSLTSDCKKMMKDLYGIN